MKMKRVLIFLFTALLMFSLAFAEEAPAYIRYDDTGDPIGWLQTCMGMTETLNNTPWFGEKTLRVLESFQEKHGLECSEEFTPETLYAMLNLSPAPSAELVWIPMHGGIKYHANFWCSGMIEPRQIPIDCARYFEFDCCERCYN